MSINLEESLRQEFDLSLQTTLVSFRLINFYNKNIDKYKGIGVFYYKKIDDKEYRIDLSDGLYLAVKDIDDEQWSLELSDGGPAYKKWTYTKCDLEDRAKDIVDILDLVVDIKKKGC